MIPKHKLDLCANVELEWSQWGKGKELDALNVKQKLQSLGSKNKEYLRLKDGLNHRWIKGDI